MWFLFLKAVCLFWCSSNYLIICTEKNTKTIIKAAAASQLTESSVQHPVSSLPQSRSKAHAEELKVLFFPTSIPCSSKYHVSKHPTGKTNFMFYIFLEPVYFYSVHLIWNATRLSARCKNFSYCILLCFCLIVGPTYWELTVTLWYPLLHISLALVFSCHSSFIHPGTNIHLHVAQANRSWLWREIFCRRKLQDSFNAHLSKPWFHHSNLFMLISFLGLKICSVLWTFILVLGHQLTATSQLSCRHR